MASVATFNSKKSPKYSEFDSEDDFMLLNEEIEAMSKTESFNSMNNYLPHAENELICESISGESSEVDFIESGEMLMTASESASSGYPPSLFSFLDEDDDDKEKQPQPHSMPLTKDNLANWNSQREDRFRKNVHQMVCDFNSVHVSSNYVKVPPRDPWEDLIFNDQGYGGFEEQIYFHPYPSHYPSDYIYAPSDNNSIPYSLLSNSESSSLATSPSDSQLYSEFVYDNNNQNVFTDGFAVSHPDNQVEFSQVEFQEHLKSKIGAEKSFVPPVTSTPVPVQQNEPNYLLFNQQNLNWQIFLQSFERFHNIPFEKAICANNFDPKAANRRIKVKPNKKSLEDFCGFCKNNGQPEIVYRCHTVKDANGRVLCPMLRVYKCSICGKDGDDAHTKKYCPYKKIFTYEDLLNADKKNNNKSVAPK